MRRARRVRARAALAAAVTLALAAGFGHAPRAARAQTSPGSPSAPAAGPRERAREVLRGRPFGFCHDARRLVRPAELRYCGLVAEQSACPEFAAACARYARRPPSCRAPGAPGALGRGAQYAALAALVVLAGALAVLVVRGWLRARRVESLVDAEPLTDPRESPAEVPLAGSGELLARARAAHDQGDHPAALYALYAALLRRLDERGAIRIEPSSTNGDYVRQCASDELGAPLREAVREVERVRFGGAPATPEAFDRLWARVEPVVRALAALALGLALGAGTAACDAEGGTPGGPEGLAGGVGAGAAGHRAVRTFLSREGLPTGRLTEALEDLQEPARAIVVDSRDVEVDGEQWAAVLRWVERGGALVVAGEPFPRELGLDTERRPTGEASNPALAPAYGVPEFANVAPGAPAFRRPVRGYVVASYAGSDAPYAVLVPRGAGRVLALASNELVVNAGLAMGDNPVVTLALLRQFAAGRPIYFAERDAGAGANPFVGLARAGLLPAVLQGLLALLLFYLMVGRHFATPRDRALVSRRAFAEHVRAVGGLYARARATGPVLRAYGQLVAERVRERAGGASRDVAEALAARTGASREEVDAVFRELERAAAEEPGGAGAARRTEQELRLVKRLNGWLRQLG